MLIHETLTRMQRPLFSRTVKHLCFLWWWVFVIHMLTNRAFLGRLTLMGGFLMSGEFNRMLEPFAPAAFGAVNGGAMAYLWPSWVSAAFIAIACALTVWMLLRKDPAVPPPLR